MDEQAFEKLLFGFASDVGLPVDIVRADIGSLADLWEDIVRRTGARFGAAVEYLQGMVRAYMLATGYFRTLDSCYLVYEPEVVLKTLIVNRVTNSSYYPNLRDAAFSSMDNARKAWASYERLRRRKGASFYPVR